jgi:hypothetical protein
MEIEKLTISVQGVDIPLKIPPEFVKEFKKELRIVIRHPWIIGIPVPERLLSHEAFDKLRENFDVFLTPGGSMR